MTLTLISAALLMATQATATPPNAEPQLTPASHTALRCSAAFALVSFGQEVGDPEATKWPAMEPRGREYFIRVMAKIMDETGLDRDSVAALAEKEAKLLLDKKEIESVMPQCLVLLDQSGI